MTSSQNIKGFSKLNRQDKINWLARTFQLDTEVLSNWLVQDDSMALIVDQLSENTIAHFPFPYGVAPGFKINNKWYTLPFVTEESSVVAALAKAAKTWSNLGGFHAETIATDKEGQVHFFLQDDYQWLKLNFDSLKEKLLTDVQPLSESMNKRGGGIIDIRLLDKTTQLENYFQLAVTFDTRDAMGANFINSCLEQMASTLQAYFQTNSRSHLLEVNMAILSNYTPNCKVRVWVECSIDKLNDLVKGMSGETLCRKLKNAVDIAQVDVSRAVTHNKGIFNGIDALALATGNDWRAIEAGGHAYAAKDGKYRSLSKATITNNLFRLELEIPLALGTVGGVTSIHPMTKFSMQLMGNPAAAQLMQLMAVAGLASNLSALIALVGTGIQKGHMKMHLNNILTELKATDNQKQAAKVYFENKTISVAGVKAFLQNSNAYE
ncbi:hydroxymethylglutaryl-CoA reductase, degradative [Prolixibacteraceae bacterium JC049]|nr:hydroxymethylglutaryl-CoA reductase, degradative [Prolixibacteraceae bacterium JC049]